MNPLSLRRYTGTGLRRVVWLGIALLSGCASTLVPPLEPIKTEPAPAFEAPPRTPSEPPSPPRSVVIIEAPNPVDPLRPEVPVDLNDAHAHADLWKRIRAGFAIADLDNDLVREREQWYASRPEYVQRMTERGSRYLFHIVEEVQRRGMPTELALLPFIESAFNPQAMSTAKASGMWQFMPATGRDFSLKQNIFRDDRRDVLASTRAALDYLARLYQTFGDWHLALAAYNWGEGNVQRAMARNKQANLPADYANLRMPNETQLYLPKLQAVKNIITRPEAFSLTLPPIDNHPYFLSVPITRDIDVDLAARFAGLPVEEFKDLNPQMNKPVILAAGTPYVLLPYDNADKFVHALGDHDGPLATWTAWVAPKTLRPSEAAKHVGMSEAQLCEINHIPPRMLVKAGSTLLVPRKSLRAEDDVSLQVANNASISLTPEVPPTHRVSIKAGKRETVSSVARRYSVAPSQVAQWNRVHTTATFRPGQLIVLYLAGKKAVSKMASTTRKASPARSLRQASAKSSSGLANGAKLSLRSSAAE